jgi:ribonuclease E
VAEVTSLGLVQMTRKRVGQGLLEAFSETCDHCNGRGIIVHMDPVEAHGRKSNDRSGNGSERGERSNGANGDNGHEQHEHDHEQDHDEHENGNGAGSGNGNGNGAHRDGSSAAESRASRRRRRKGKHHEGDGDGADAPGMPVEAAWPVDRHTPSVAAAAESAAESAVEAAPINLKAHAEDPDAVNVGEDLGGALVDTGRPRKRRRAASRPAGSPQSTAPSAAEAS